MVFLPNNARTIIAFVAISSSTQAQLQTPGFIAGFQARTDVDEFLRLDLIQLQFEYILAVETCAAFDNGKTFWQATGPDEGGYLRSIPTFNDTVSDEWNEYIQYTGSSDFHIEWVDAAFDRGKTQFTRGNADFERGFGGLGEEGKNLIGALQNGNCVGYEESVKKAVAFTFNYIESMQLMQKAIDLVVDTNCIFGTGGQSGSCDSAMKAWDASVAIFVGSLEGRTGNNSPKGDYGKFLYSLADKRCDDFMVCGANGNTANRQDSAYINRKILTLYTGGAQATANGIVEDMIRFKRLVSSKMAVPFIQGLLRYAYRLSDAAGPNTFSVSDKNVAEAGTFALGALPKLWACSSKGAKVVETEMKIGGSKAGKQAINFDAVRLAFECNYRCLGITCDEVGSLFDGQSTPKYMTCDDVQNGSDKVGVANCVAPTGQRKTMCKKFIGKPGINGRDKFSYFVNGL